MKTAHRVLCYVPLFMLIMPLVSLVFITALSASNTNDPFAFITRLLSQGQFEFFLMTYAFGVPASFAAGTIAAMFRSRILSNLMMIAVSCTVLLLQLIILNPTYVPENFLLHCFLTILFSSLITRIIVRQVLFRVAR